jgi:hypothetical protein
MAMLMIIAPSTDAGSPWKKEIAPQRTQRSQRKEEFFNYWKIRVMLWKGINFYSEKTF